MIPSPKGRGFCLTYMREELDSLVGNSGRITDGWYFSSPDPACGDDAGRIDVRIHLPAGCTEELSSIPASDPEALVAGHARSERVDIFRPEPNPEGFVLGELLHFREGPARDHPVQVRAPRPRSLPDATEVLESKGAEAAPDRLSHDGLRDVVVHPCLKAPLLPRQASQDALCAPSAFGLERRPDTGVISLLGLDSLPGNLPAARQCGNISDTEVDSERRPK